MKMNWKQILLLSLVLIISLTSIVSADVDLYEELSEEDEDELETDSIIESCTDYELDTNSEC